MPRVGEGAAVHVVNQGAGTLVAALALAVDSGYGVLLCGVQSLNRLNEAIGGPGVVIQVQILVGASRLESVQINAHAVGGDKHGVLINLAVGAGAGGQRGGVDLSAVGIINHVGQIHHIALGAPVGHQALGTFHNQVGGLLRGNGGIHLVVAVGVGQPLQIDLDAGGRGKLIHQGLDVGLLRPAAHGINPSGDLCGGARGRGGAGRGIASRRGIAARRGIALGSASSAAGGEG